MRKVPGLLLLTFEKVEEIITEPLIPGPQAKTEATKNENLNTIL